MLYKKMVLLSLLSMLGGSCFASQEYTTDEDESAVVGDYADFVYAAMDGSVETVYAAAALVDSDAREAALIRAADAGKLDIVALLVGVPVQLGGVTKRLSVELCPYETIDEALGCASFKGHLAIVALLMGAPYNGYQLPAEQRADLHYDFDYALRIAILRGHDRVVDFLMGAEEINGYRIAPGQTASVVNQNDRAYYEVLRYSAIQLAVQQGNKRMMLFFLTQLIAQQGLLGIIDSINQLLIVAVRHDRAAIAYDLLTKLPAQYRANIQYGGNAAVKVAATRGSKEALTLLLGFPDTHGNQLPKELHVDIHSERDVVLRSAVYAGQLAIVQWLLGLPSGYLPSVAIRNECFLAASQLALQAKNDPSSTISSHSNYREIARCLLWAGATNIVRLSQDELLAISYTA